MLQSHPTKAQARPLTLQPPPSASHFALYNILCARISYVTRMLLSFHFIGGSKVFLPSPLPACGPLALLASLLRSHVCAPPLRSLSCSCHNQSSHSSIMPSALRHASSRAIYPPIDYIFQDLHLFVPLHQQPSWAPHVLSDAITHLAVQVFLHTVYRFHVVFMFDFISSPSLFCSLQSLY